METKYNMKSPAVKRLMKEAMELRNPTEEYYAQPLEENLFEWHFTVRGPPESDFDGGLYHGRIVLPPEYPMKPPSIILLTPNGRFEIQKKICLSISGHHPESWQPSWSIRTALLAIIGFMPTHGNGAIGSLDYTPAERKILAKNSHSWSCNHCGPIIGLLLERSQGPESVATSKEARELATQISFKGESYRTNYANSPSFVNSSKEERSTNDVDNYQTSNNQEVSCNGTNYFGRTADDLHSASDASFNSSSTLDVSINASNNQSRQHSQHLYTIAIWSLSIIIAALLFRRLFFL